MFRSLALSLLCVALVAPRLAAFSFTGTRWTSSTTTMHLQLGTPSATLADGFATWGASAEDALNLWNSQLASFRLSVQRDSTATRAQGNRINNVHFSSSVYGEAWGTGVLAVTLTYSSGASNTETDVLFNSALNWNSYRGALRYSSTGQPTYDFHRVALHEFGHALGLDHPDENGQSVSALMNSRISSLDALTSDDISGGQALYGAPATAPTVAPPVIVTQPTSRTVTAGQSTTFSVGATSTVALSYQWAKNGAALAGATASNFTIASATATDAGSYTVTVTNSAGSTPSAAATLTVTTPPVATAPSTPVSPPASPVVTAPQIVTPPASQTVTAGQPVNFAVTVGGTSPFTYQWRKDGTTVAGATAATFGFAAAQPADAGSYSVVVTNSAGSTPSAAATLAVNLPPAITTQPASQTVAAGTRFVLTVAAAGTPAPRFQWFKSGVALAGATATSYVVETAQAGDAGTYHATAANAAGTATSATVTVLVHALPVITAQPASQTIAAGGRVELAVAATGSPAPTYQWRRNGVDLPGATGASFVLDAAQPADAGEYAVRVANPQGAVVSATATLTVSFSRLVNLSTRGFVPAGGALTPGFYVRSAKAKPLLIRAVGPTLSSFGVGTALGEAKLDVIAQADAAIVASNADWGGATALRNAFASVGAFPLAADAKDAAVQGDFPAAGYSVRIVPGTAGMAGVTLAEIYDADSDAAGTGRLVNLSTLGFVGTGENALTAGFVIGGNAPKRLLLRAVGPGLAPFGVANRLADPQLGLVPLGRSEPLATSDDWANTPALQAAFASAGAFTLPAGSKDAALVVTLEPGAYTVVVSSVDGVSTGTALVEIYDLDP